MRNIHLTLAATALTIAAIAIAQPANAQQARYKFAPNSYLVDQPTGPRHHSGATPMQAASSVRPGQVFNVGNMFGSLFAPQPRVPAPPVIVATAPRTVQPTQHAINPNQFGRPGQPSPAVAQNYQAPPVKPQIVRTSVAGHMAKPQRHTASAPNQNKVKQVRPQQSPRVLGYKEFYSAGSTHPASYSAGSRSETRLHGEVLHR